MRRKKLRAKALCKVEFRDWQTMAEGPKPAMGCLCTKGFTGIDKSVSLFVYILSMAAFEQHSRAEGPCGPQSLKYLLSGRPEKQFGNP